MGSPPLGATNASSPAAGPAITPSAHQAVAAVNTVHANINGSFRPVTSETRPYSGWKEVAVSRKDVESQDASSEALKCELMVLCVGSERGE